MAQYIYTMNRVAKVVPPKRHIIRDISLSFGAVRAITDVSFDVKKGEIRAIIGPNGAGKTSMLNCINGFYHPQEGQIIYKGTIRRQMRPRRGGPLPGAGG